jgi:adenylate kinase
MIVILLGAPGSGKGTQSKALAAKYGFNHLSTGDIFRAEIANKTDLGQKVESILKSGKLVPDNITVEVVAGKLEAGQKYLLDGFPRNVDQAEALDKMLHAHKSQVDAVVLLDMPQAEVLKRLTSRRVCSGCGAVYNTISKPTRADGVCDACGGKVEQRSDDSEETAKKRLMVFEDLTSPLVTYYKAEQVFSQVNAAQAPETVTSELSKVIDGIMAVKR